ncbi:Asp-tRNA(Asn)/Glu-tRNA(Gln) amidotransferase subunit GatC [Patescibacteria group bacterium]|nr:Asp-tRNA(Asn)/Glu-tRNA(Gln) amidotransferase subunit GatC [Patescibacteria group bacterium]
MKRTTVSSDDVKVVARLANIPLTEAQEERLAEDFTRSMHVIDELLKVNVDNVPAVSQVTGLENVLREDAIDTKNIFTQEQALQNAKRTHNGYFVVDQILED